MIPRAIKAKPVAQVAIGKAIKKEQAEVNFNLCIKHMVCPKCSKDLEVGKVNVPPIDIPMYSTRELECSGKKCDFKHEEIIK